MPKLTVNQKTAARLAWRIAAGSIVAAAIIYVAKKFDEATPDD